MPEYTTALPDDDLFAANCDDFWVFAYGSLMWRPDFTFTRRAHARLEGYDRSLCIYSWVHRGTKERPGLVFGLDEGQSCEGFAYKIPPHALAESIKMLRARELVTNVYQEVIRPVQLLEEGCEITALVYAAVPDHEQYAGSLSHQETLRLVQQGRGKAGINADYVLSTYDHMCEENITDSRLEKLCTDLRADNR